MPGNHNYQEFYLDNSQICLDLVQSTGSPVQTFCTDTGSITSGWQIVAYSLSEGYIAVWRAIPPKMAKSTAFSIKMTTDPNQIYFAGNYDANAASGYHGLNSAVLSKWFSWNSGIPLLDLQNNLMGKQSF